MTFEARMDISQFYSEDITHADDPWPDEESATQVFLREIKSYNPQFMDYLKGYLPERIAQSPVNYGVVIRNLVETNNSNPDDSVRIKTINAIEFIIKTTGNLWVDNLKQLLQSFVDGEQKESEVLKVIETALDNIHRMQEEQKGEYNWSKPIDCFRSLTRVLLRSNNQLISMTDQTFLRQAINQTHVDLREPMEQLIHVAQSKSHSTLQQMNAFCLIRIVLEETQNDCLSENLKPLLEEIVTYYPRTGLIWQEASHTLGQINFIRGKNYMGLDVQPSNAQGRGKIFTHTRQPIVN